MLTSCLFASSIIIGLLQNSEPPVAAADDHYHLHEGNLYQVGVKLSLNGPNTLFTLSRLTCNILEIFG
jgi:hypothetical protein